ncbi:hypothetical protein SISNIDRAFT_466202 [Sistotremastrum niveocremeum HHB9708]|uniref:KN homeodomain domain-containing protein n=1 Tax=Sistotremastrum niveocremeum HHB9708 TaxID=1314777 RepID=A0A164UQQ7_9AGAM|nr:hypothetical protein SISNIDRAFT_466202 [Sistotremastrum niveocremeum HHB9708]
MESLNENIRHRLLSIERQFLTVSLLDEPMLEQFHTKWTSLWLEFSSALDKGCLDIDVVRLAHNVATSVKIISTEYLKVSKNCRDMRTRHMQSVRRILEEEEAINHSNRRPPNSASMAALPRAVQIAAADFLLSHIHHPFPTHSELEALAPDHPIEQISAWFTSARRRLGYSRLAKKYCQGDRRVLRRYLSHVLAGAPAVELSLEAEKAIQRLKQDAAGLMREVRNLEPEPECSRHLYSPQPATCKSVSGSHHFSYPGVGLRGLRSASSQSFDSDATVVSSSRSVSSSSSSATLTDPTISESSSSNIEDNVMDPERIASPKSRKRKREAIPEPQPSPKRHQFLGPTPPLSDEAFQDILQQFRADWSTEPGLGLTPELSRLEGEITPNVWTIPKNGFDEFESLFAWSGELAPPIVSTRDMDHDSAPLPFFYSGGQSVVEDWFSRIPSETDVMVDDSSPNGSSSVQTTPSTSPCTIPSSFVSPPLPIDQANKRAQLLAELEKKREEMKHLELELAYA